MVLPKPRPSYMTEEYLKLERLSDERHEYIDGEVYAMAGESLAHSRICVDLALTLGNQLKQKPCEVLSPNMKVRSGPPIKQQKSKKGMFSYADVSVVCGEPLFHDEFQDVLLNPTVIIEVLSPSTESFDRGEKFHRYRTWVDSLTDYVVVSQSLPAVDHFGRQPDGKWLLTPVFGLEGSIYLASINCHLHLGEIYGRVTFADAEPEQETAEFQTL